MTKTEQKSSKAFQDIWINIMPSETETEFRL